MVTPDLLATVDERDWAAVSSASGPATGVPALLRAVAAGVEPAADEAVVQLIDELHDPGTSWTATAPTVPFLVELALAPTVPHRGSLLYLLARLSMVDLVEVIGPHVSRLLPLLDDPVAEVRQTTAHLLGQHPAHREAALPALRDRFRREDDPHACASMLMAVAALDHDAGSRLVAAGLKDRRVAVRAAAGLAIVWMAGWWPQAKVRFPRRAAEAVASAFTDGDPLRGWVWTDDAMGELLRVFPNALRAPRVMLAVLARSPSARVRRDVTLVVHSLTTAVHGQPSAVVPALRPLLADRSAELRRLAAAAARNSGSAAALVADELAALVADVTDRWSVAGQEPAAADEARQDLGAAEAALDALIWVDDPRWRPGVVRLWQSGGHDLERLANALIDAAPPAEPELFAAVAARVDLLAAHHPGRTEVSRLARLLSGWGSTAAPAVGPLRAALDHENDCERVVAGALCDALAAIGAPARSAAPAVRTAAERGFRVSDRGAAALAYWRLTGDPEPALGVGAANLAGDGEEHEPHLIRHLLDLGEAARPLLPALRRHVADRPERLRGNTAVAHLLWRLDADPGEVVPVLRAALEFSDPLTEALTPAVELGPALAAPLTPLIRTLLTSKVRWRQVAAARALHRLGAADVDEVLAVILPPPTAFEYWQHHAARAAVDLVVELRATQAAQRLTAYLDGKVRIRFGTTNDRIRDDERLRERIRQALATLPG